MDGDSPTEETPKSTVVFKEPVTPDTSGLSASDDAYSDLDPDLGPEPFSFSLSPGPVRAITSGTSELYKSLNGAQTERLRRYLDEQTLAITRAYVRRVNGQGFVNINMLINALTRLTDLIQYSLQSTDHTGGRFEVNYLMKIADEFADQLSGYFTDDPELVISNVKPILVFFRRLDFMFEALIQSDLNSGTSSRIISPTDHVRLNSIASRSRIVASRCFDRLGDGFSQYKYAATKVYEKTLSVRVERLGPNDLSLNLPNEDET